MKVAIVGSGVSGLVCAHMLGPHHDVTVFEADDRAGGHTNTVTVGLPDGTFEVDTGFIVFNEANYPGFSDLLRRLDIAVQPSEMSFSVNHEASGVQWRGSSLGTVFAQPRNAFRPQFLAMLGDIARFNRLARHLLTEPDDPDLSLEDVLSAHRWSSAFRDWYLVPMGSAIWSADPTTFTRFPATTFSRFLDNHGLLRIRNPVRWQTITGGARRYVRAIVEPLGTRLRLSTPVHSVERSAEGVTVQPASGPAEQFDHVVLACHSDQALAMLIDADAVEREILAAIAYQPNLATLHTDARMLPSASRARASWNYYCPAAGSDRPTLTYSMNRLQSLATSTEVCVTLNRHDEIDPASVLATFDYSHPVYDSAALRAQRRHAEIDGRRRTSFCGAYWGHGFHEDGVQSALNVCRRLRAIP